MQPKPIGEMSPSEIAEWHRSLAEKGSNPAKVDYPPRPDGITSRYDRQSGMVIETGPDGIEWVLNVQGGNLHRSLLAKDEELSPVRRRPQGPESVPRAGESVA